MVSTGRDLRRDGAKAFVSGEVVPEPLAKFSPVLDREKAESSLFNLPVRFFDREESRPAQASEMPRRGSKVAPNPEGAV